MEAIFSWIAAALGALFVVAVVVAWWEHLVRSSRPPAPPEPAPQRAVSVDVQLDALPAAEPAAPAAPATPAAPPPVNDALRRRATLDGAMSRMARPDPDSNGWTETSPMVLHPPADGPALGDPSPEPLPQVTSRPEEPTPTRA